MEINYCPYCGSDQLERKFFVELNSDAKKYRCADCKEVFVIHTEKS